MILTDGDVLREIEAKNIVITPFRREVESQYCEYNKIVFGKQFL
jgi:hypothetical protein